MKPKMLAPIIVVVLVALGAGAYVMGRDNDKNSGSGFATTQESTSQADATADAPTAMVKKALDPGTSINPQDKGKSISSDTFKYTLLDAREDSVDDVYAQYGKGKVYMVKLEVERIANDTTVDAGKEQGGLSVLEVSLNADTTTPEHSSTEASSFSNDIYYSRSKLGLALGEDVKQLKLGEKATGYYTYDAEQHKDAKAVYFVAYNASGMSATNGTLFKVGGALRIK